MRTFFLHVEEKSPLLRAHPALKILALLVVNLLAWILEAPIFLLALLTALLISYRAFGIPLSRMARFLVFAGLIAQAVMVSYLLGSKIPGRVTYLVLPWGSYVTDMTLLYSLTMILRFVSMLVGSTLILAVMRDVDIVYGLKSFGLPYSLSFAFSLAFRLSSLFLEDFKMVKDAMLLRGAKLDKGGILERARNYSRMGVPLTVIAVRRMNELSYVLEAKGFASSRKRSYLYEFKWNSLGICAALFLVGLVALALLLRLSTDLVTFPGWPLV